MSTSSLKPPAMETIQQLLFAPYPSFALMAACQLDVFTPLKDGALTAQELAEKLNVGMSKLRPLLYALVAAKLLTVNDERFANTEESGYYLVQGQPAYTGKRLNIAAKAWPAMLKTAESIRMGVGQAHQEFDFAMMPAENVEALLRGFHAPALATAKMLANKFDFSKRQSLLDVGGGSGDVSIALLEKFPHLHATIVEQTNVAPVTQRIVAESGVAERIRVVAANAVNDSLEGAYDCAILSAVIQLLSAEEAQRLLKNVARVLNPGGAIYIIGWVVDNSRVTPREAATVNLLLINAYVDGQAYTESEHRAWLTEAGFEDFAREILPSELSLVSARKRRDG
ncbi:MAG: acetylserotonin O-methyltransferase [Ardenticatenaceae bacterium]|nr:acetylserotonin O-methyltransferase [Ardenticatenaceae bacterium]